MCSNICREAALLGYTIIATICLTLTTWSNAFLCYYINLLLKFLTSQRTAGASVSRERRRRVKKNRSPGNKCQMFYTISSPWEDKDKGEGKKRHYQLWKVQCYCFCFFWSIETLEKQSKAKHKASKWACDQSLTFCSKTLRELIKD